MSIRQNFPTTPPSLVLDFANSKTLDPRITFSRTTTATRMNELGLIETVDADVARFDHEYDASTGVVKSLGLLIEASRSNLTENSETLFDYSNTRVSNNTISTGGPFGTGYHEKTITDANTSNYNFHFNNQISITAGQTITFSIFLRNVDITNNQFYLRFWTGTGRAWTNQRQVRYNLTNLTTSVSSGTIVNSSIQPFPDDWYRLSMTATADQDGLAAESFYTSSNSVGEKYQLMGAQLEVGAYPTSYIPTTGSTATRNPDNVSMTGTNFSDWYNQSEGTVYCSCKINSTSTVRVFNIDDGTASNRISGLAGGNVYQTYIVPPATGITANITPTNYNLKIASAHQDNNVQVYVNSSYQNSNTSITIPKNLNTFRIGNWQQGTLQGTTISKLTYYPTRLSNDNLQNLTK